jgi:hypothetical protein
LSPIDNPGTHNLDPKENTSLYSIENQGTRNTEYILSIGLLATALMVCVVVFIIVTSVILIRSKAKIKAALQQSASPGETTVMNLTTPAVTSSSGLILFLINLLQAFESSKRHT